MDWIKIYTRKWIWGSGRTMSPEKRGIWMDLLALAAECKFRDGTLRHDEGQPMKRDWICNVLMLDRNSLDVALVAFQADINIDDGQSRIKIWEDGTIQITNWYKYQDDEKNKDRQKNYAIKKKDSQKLRQLANKYPGVTLNVVQRDFGWDVTNRSTGEFLEYVEDTE